MGEPEPYPAWVEGVVVANAEEEAAVREGRAILETVKSAGGDQARIVGIHPKETLVERVKAAVSKKPKG